MRERESVGRRRRQAEKVVMGLAICAELCACTPRVEIAAPEKPITINLNVKIEHEVKVKIEKQLEDEVFSKDSKLF
ncbi:MAG: YnbE family lipoprotein [Bdellovibrionota bacterium]